MRIRRPQRGCRRTPVTEFRRQRSRGSHRAMWVAPSSAGCSSYAGRNAKADALVQALIDKVEDHGRFDAAETAELARRTATAC
jgi:hypothetical protein